MDTPKTKSLERIEAQMEELDPSSLRYHILESAKSFKTSWVSLGRALYAVHKDKLYKEWGYSTIETYILKEIGIKKPTAMKLLRSYYFLEKEEPQYLQKEYAEQANAAVMPSYESIDLLRKAKSNKALDEEDYKKIKKNVFEVGKDPQLIKRDLTSLMRQRKDVNPEEEQERSRTMTIKRYLSTLRAMKREIEISKLLPVSLLKETEGLIEKLEQEV